MSSYRLLDDDADATVASATAPPGAVHPPKSHRAVDADLGYVPPELDNRYVIPDHSTTHMDRHLISSKPSKPSVSDEDVFLAATLIGDAQHHHKSRYSRDMEQLKAYAAYNSQLYTIAVDIVLILDLCLAIFENPAPRQVLAPAWVTSVIELFFIAFFCLRLHSRRCFYSSQKRFWHDKKHRFLIVIVAIQLVDIFMYFIMLKFDPDHAVRWSRVLRPTYIIIFKEQIRRGFRNIRRTVPKTLPVVCLVLLNVGMFTMFGMVLYQGTEEGRMYFNTFPDGFWNLYVLVTTANFPDVMMPAYSQNRANALLFVVFLITSLFVLISITFAVIYNQYRSFLKEELRHVIIRQRHAILKAFNILCTADATLEKGTFLRLMRVLSPEDTEEKRLLHWLVLDVDNSGTVGYERFSRIVDLLNIRITQIHGSVHIFVKMCPGFYYSAPSVLICRAVSHKYFRWLFDALILTNAVLSLVISSTDPRNQAVDIVFVCLFNMELLLKLYAMGPRAFIRDVWNVFDVIVMTVATIAVVVQVAQDAETTSHAFDFVSFSVLLRLCRLIKLIYHIPVFHLTLKTIVELKPAFMTYGAIVTCIYYVFAIVGMEIWGNMISTGCPNPQQYNFTIPVSYDDTFTCEVNNNPKLYDSGFEADNYFANNFNSIGESFVTLFECTVVNQWHVITEGFVFLTSKWARLYFFVFHLSMVVFLVNIVVAFIVEAFTMQLDLDSSKVEDDLIKRVEEIGVSTESSEYTMADERLMEDRTDFTDEEDDFSGSPNSQSLSNVVRNHSQSTTSHSESDPVSSSTVASLAHRYRALYKTTAETILQQIFAAELTEEELMSLDVEELDEDTERAVQSDSLNSNVFSRFSRIFAATHS